MEGDESTPLTQYPPEGVEWHNRWAELENAYALLESQNESLQKKVSDLQGALQEKVQDAEKKADDDELLRQKIELQQQVDRLLGEEVRKEEKIARLAKDLEKQTETMSEMSRAKFQMEYEKSRTQSEMLPLTAQRDRLQKEKEMKDRMIDDLRKELASSRDEQDKLFREKFEVARDLRRELQAAKAEASYQQQMAEDALQAQYREKKLKEELERKVKDLSEDFAAKKATLEDQKRISDDRAKRMDENWKQTQAIMRHVHRMPPLRTQHFVQASAPSVAVNQMYPRVVSGYAPAVPLQRPLAAPAPRMLRSGPQLPRMLRVGPVAVQVMEEPSMQSKRLPWVVQEPGQVVLTSGATHGEWVQLLFAHLRKGWAPLRSFLPEPRGGMHGDGMYDGLDRAICSHQSEMLEVILGELKPRQLSRADGQSFHLQKDGWQAYAWLPACQGPVPLIVVLHGSRPMDWDFLSQFAERWQKDAMEYQVAVIVPESIGPTWDYLLTCQRKDMDFIEYAINEVRSKVDVDDRSIAVMGMSDGASLALSMALRNPRVFTTALVQATGFFHDPLPMRLKPRVYMEYGQEDKLFEPDRVAYPNRDRLREDGCEVEFMMIPGAGHMVQEEFFHRALDFWLRGARPSTR